MRHSEQQVLAAAQRRADSYLSDYGTESLDGRSYNDLVSSFCTVIEQDEDVAAFTD
jgi:hypothetical protein